MNFDRQLFKFKRNCVKKSYLLQMHSDADHNQTNALSLAVNDFNNIEFLIIWVGI